MNGINELLRAGADKVSLNSSAVKDPSLISQGANRFGSQCIVVAIDAKKNKHIPNKWDVYVSGGRKNTGLDAIEWAEKIFEMGAGEILLTSMDGDGTQNGYDIELTRCISEKVSIPVIASGGAGSLSHIKDAFTLGKSSAALLASLLHDGQLTIREIKEYLIKENLPIRPIE